MRKFLVAVLLAGTIASPALAQDWRDHPRGRHGQETDDGATATPAPSPEAHHPHADGGFAPPQAPEPEHRPVIVQHGPGEESSGARFDGGFAGPQAPHFDHRPPVIVQHDDGRAPEAPRWGDGRGNVNPGGDSPSGRFSGSRDGGPDGSEGPRPHVVTRGPVIIEQDESSSPGRPHWVRRPATVTPGDDGVVDRSDRFPGRRGDGSGYAGQGTYQPGSGRRWTPPVSVTPRFGTQPPPRVQSRGNWVNRGWDPNWGGDHRYDWRRWRDHHRSFFHVGIYYDPFGWRYQPFDIGWRMWPAYYGQRYWISDPWDYQLPVPPPGTVWVRYWDDALLVDIYSGEVVDVIRNFFW
jgi:Ni/Co efflux regulator RcnB